MCVYIYTIVANLYRTKLADLPLSLSLSSFLYRISLFLIQNLNNLSSIINVRPYRIIEASDLQCVIPLGFTIVRETLARCRAYFSLF